ncbi:MAG: DUF4276 family protein [Actinomycetota bacterium]|nr:DUF4276 family protein [Actinomycetota bacterium]
MSSVPILLRRIAQSLNPAVAVSVPPPFRVPADKLCRPGELERHVELAARKVGAGGGVLVLLDADDDERCPARLGPELLARCIAQRGDVHISVVLAKREFEAWFLAAATSVAGRRGLAHDLQRPQNPEEVRGAKEWLRRHMAPGTTYAPTQDQPALTALFDISAARATAPSFEKFHREVVRLLVSGDA